MRRAWLLLTCRRCRNSMRYLWSNPYTFAQLRQRVRARWRAMPLSHGGSHYLPTCADDAKPESRKEARARIARNRWSAAWSAGPDAGHTAEAAWRSSDTLS